MDIGVICINKSEMKCYLQGEIENQAHFPRLESRFFNYLFLCWFVWVVFGFGGVFFYLCLFFLFCFCLGFWGVFIVCLCGFGFFVV